MPGWLFVFMSCVGVFKVNVVAQLQQHYLHPDTGLNISQLLERYGYPFEDHVVQTQDGYLLGLHRIPHGVNNTIRESNKSIILIVHALLSQSIDFVNNEPEKSLGLLLADNGYDVWLLNCRGNTYSRKHVHLDPDVNIKEFWDFSWHEIGVYDLPNTIDYILNITQQSKLFYLGHSQGTTTYFVMSSVLPEYNSKIRLMTALGPTAFLANNHDIKYRTLANFRKEIEFLALVLKIHELLPHNEIYLDLAKTFCIEGMDTYYLCEFIYILTAGYSPTEFNMTMLPVHVSNTPSGSSIKQVFHYWQLMTNGGLFRAYDYGSLANFVKYGRPTPPEYNLTNAIAPITLHYSQEDQVTDYKDVQLLGVMLPNAKLRKIPLKHFTHLDFIWGNNVKTLIFDYLLKDLSNY